MTSHLSGLSWKDGVALSTLLLPLALLVRASQALGASCAAIFGPLDSLLVGYVFEWVYLAASGGLGVGTLWSPPYFFPEENLLAYTDNFFAGQLFYAPLRIVGWEPAAALFLVNLLQRAITPIVAYACLRALRMGRWPSFVGAMVYSWGWARFWQYGHMQFSPGYLIPLAVTATVLALRTARFRYWVVVAWTFVFTWYFPMYWAVFFVFLGALGALVAVLLPGGVQKTREAFLTLVAAARDRPWKALLALALCALALVALLPSVPHYLEAQQYQGNPGSDQVRTYWADYWTWLRPDSRNLLWGSLNQYFPAATAPVLEKNGFFGWFGLLALLAPAGSLFLGRRTRGQWSHSQLALSVTGAVSIFLFSSYDGSWLETPFWFLHDHFPGMSGVRAPTRVAMIIAWFSVVCSGVILERLAKHRALGFRVLGVVLGVLLVAENWTPTPPMADRCAGQEVWSETQQQVCSQVDRSRIGTAIFMPIEFNSFRRLIQQTRAMNLGLGCGLNVVNGYVGQRPPKIAPLLNAARLPCTDLAGLLDEIHERTDKGVLVHLDHGPPLGPSKYSAESLKSCLSRCRDLTMSYESTETRPATIFSTRPDQRCVPPKPLT